MSALLLVVSLAAGPGPTPPPDSAVLRVTPTRYELAVRIDYEQQRLEGTARLTLRNFSDTPVTDVPLLLYRLLVVRAVEVNGTAAPWTQRVVSFSDFPQLQVAQASVTLPAPLPAGGSVNVQIRYDGYLLGYQETGMAYVRDHIDASFTILRNDGLAFPEIGYPTQEVNRRAPLPSYDYLARITVPESLVVVNGGRLVERAVAAGWATYVYRSVKPSWRMDFAIGDYAVIEDGPIRVAHLRRDSIGAKRIAASARRSLDLFTAWFGPLPGDPSLTILELEDGYGSQADVAAIMQAAAAFRDSTRDHELYHEVAHLWNPAATDLPSPRWNEGLSSFLEYLAEEQFTGKPVTAARADRLLDWLRSIAPGRERLTRIPLIDYGKEQMTDFSYSEGALLFHLLYGVVGPERFHAIIGGFSRRYATTGASTSDFVALATQTAPMDLRPLFHDWVYTTEWWGAIKDGATYAELVRHYTPAR